MKILQLLGLILVFIIILAVASYCQNQPCEIPDVLNHLEKFSSCSSALKEDDLLVVLGPGCVSIEQDWTEEKTPAQYYIVHQYLLKKENKWCWAVVEGSAEKKIILLGISAIALSKNNCCNRCEDHILPTSVQTQLFGVTIGDSVSSLIEIIGNPQIRKHGYLGQTGPWDILQYERDSCSYKFYLKRGKVFAFSVEYS